MNANLIYQIWLDTSYGSRVRSEQEKQHYRDHLEEWIDAELEYRLDDWSNRSDYWRRVVADEVSSSRQQPINSWWLEKEQLYIQAMQRRWTEVTQDGSLRTRTTQGGTDNTATVRFRAAVPEDHFQQRNDFLKQANQPQTSAPYQYGASVGQPAAKRQKL